MLVSLTAVAGGMASSPPVAHALPAPAAPAVASAGPVTRAVSGFGTAARPPAPAQCQAVVHLSCYSPPQLQRAYDLGPLYARGFDGKGRTIVIVDPFGSPTVRHDLTVFDHAFRLPAPPQFRVVQPVGKVPPYDPNNPAMVDKAGETTGDVELAHALAPGANILLVETPVAETATGGGFPQMMAAENYVIGHNVGDVISQSFSLPEPNFPSASSIFALRYAYLSAVRHRVTVLAASNDYGVTGPTAANTYYQHRVVYWPASDPLVTGVGGTTLHLDPAGRRTSPDTVWNESRNLAVAHYASPIPWAGNGGVSAVFSRPGYQHGVQSITGSHRGVPDVSLSASFSGGILFYSSYPVAYYRGGYGWGIGGGTSAATPEFAGIVAIADQYAHRRLGLINPALYRLEQAHAAGIVDVTKGNNTVTFPVNGQPFTLTGYSAARGYNLATGLGTVNAARLVPELAATG